MHRLAPKLTLQYVDHSPKELIFRMGSDDISPSPFLLRVPKQGNFITDYTTRCFTDNCRDCPGSIVNETLGHRFICKCLCHNNSMQVYRDSPQVSSDVFADINDSIVLEKQRTVNNLEVHT